jgi:hypothetical protein
MGRRLSVFPMELMLHLLDYVAFALLVTISLAGFIAAFAWTLAIWFGKNS